MGLVWAEWGQSAFSSVDKRRNLTDRDITEMILESDSWCTFIGRQRHFCSEWQWHYRHKLQTVDSQYTLSYCTCTPQVYRRSQWVTKNRGTPHQLTRFPSEHSPFSSFLKLYNCWWKKQIDVVCFLLGNSLPSEFYVLTFQNTLSVPSSNLPAYEDGTDSVFQNIGI
jgi:hypothetical protein